MADEIIKAGVEIVSTTGTIELVNSSNPLSQWDLNRRINIFGYQNAQYVHFWHTVESKGYTVKIKEENGQRYAEIPNIMLQVVGDITVYISNGEWSIYQAKLTMIANEGGNNEQYNNSYTWTEVVLKSDIERQETNLNGYIWQQYQTVTNEQTLLKTKGEPTGFYVINDDPNYLPKNGYNETDNYWYVQLETIATESFIAETYAKKNESANALIETASGRDAIAIINPLSVEHNVKLNVSRVNLMSSPFAELDFLEQGKNYTFSVKLKEDIELPSDYYYIFQSETAEGNTIDHTLYEDNRELTYSFTIGEEYSLFRIIYDSRLTAGMFEYCQLEEGNVATAPVPYIEDMNNISYYAYGKNLCDMSKISAKDGEDTVKLIDKNTIKWNGTYCFFIPVSIPVGTTFTWSYPKEFPGGLGVMI